MPGEPRRWEAPGRGTSAALAMVVAVSACPTCPPAGGPDPAQGPGEVRTQALNLVKCPAHPFSIELTSKTDRHLVPYVITQEPLAGAMAASPESHDCQRLSPGAEQEYRALAAIFASERLPVLFEPGVGSSPPGTQRAAAAIYTDGAYDPLGIPPGRSCLYIWRRPSAPPPGADSLDATIIAATDDSTCVRPLERVQPTLEVRAYRPAALESSELPVAARWGGTAGRENMHYISIRCGDRWCDVGRRQFGHPPRRPAAFVPSGPSRPGLTAPTNHAVASVEDIPGWFDEQLIALPGTAPLRASREHSILAPHPDLNALDAVSDFTGGWVQVARATLPGGLTSYVSKLNFAPGANDLYFRFGTEREALMGAAPARACRTPRAREAKGWWAKVVSSTGTVAYYCVEFHQHPTLRKIPGLVRWQWLDDDEKVWVKCPGGCCELN